MNADISEQSAARHGPSGMQTSDSIQHGVDTVRRSRSRVPGATLVTGLGLPSFTSATTLVGTCTAGGCAGVPVLLKWTILGTLLTPVAGVVHLASIFIFPVVNLLLLRRSFRRHRNPNGLVVAACGVGFIYLHVLSHFHHGTHGDEPLLYIGLALLFIASLLDLYLQRRWIAQRLSR